MMRLGRCWYESAHGGEEGYSDVGSGEGLLSVNGLVFIEGDGVDDDDFTVVGSARDLNEALRDLRHRGKPGEQVLLVALKKKKILQLDYFIFLALKYKFIGLGCDQREAIGLASRCFPWHFRFLESLRKQNNHPFLFVSIGDRNRKTMGFQ
jgi:hypothetical protein